MLSGVAEVCLALKTFTVLDTHDRNVNSMIAAGYVF